MPPLAARALPRSLAPPRLLALCATMLLLLATFATPALGEPPEGIHCPSDGTGAPSAAVEGASGEITDDRVTVNWSGDPGSATVTNTNDLPATVTWCAKGGTAFAADGSMNLGEVSTTLAPGQVVTAGPFGTEISYFVVYDVTLDPGPDPVGITLVKQWFDAEGTATDAPDDDWAVEMTSAGGVVAAVPGEVDTATFTSSYDAATASWIPASYAVTETTLPEGWEEVDCAEVAATGAPIATGTGTDFTADADGIHLVCNQPIDQTEPEVFDLTIAKVWLDLDDEVTDEPEDVTWAVTLTVDDEVVASLPGDDDTYTSTEPVDGYTVDEDLPTGWEVVDCPAEVLTSTGAGADGIGTFDGDADGLHLVCNGPDVEVLPIVITPPRTEVGTEVGTEVEEVVEAGEVEVLAEVVARTASLPRTGGPIAPLLPLALVLLGLGLTTVRLTRRNGDGPPTRH